tara:strand:+ start:2899 stop:3411 length:513 start_codon:yes stop_codon:yes gene_type:complete
MNRKTKIALFGGLIAVPLAVFTISYFNRRIRYSKLSKLIGATPSGTGTLPDLMDNPETAQAFNVDYHKGATIPVGNYLKSPNNQVMRWRDDIYEAGHGGTGFGTDEVKIEGVFRSIPDKVAVSQVADSYYNRYSMDLYADLISELSGYGDDKVMARINARVNQMPNYTTY